MNTVSKNLNEIQLHFLQYFSEFEVSEQETKDIKNMVSKYYFDKAEIALENTIIEKNIDLIAMENNPNLHFRAKKNNFQ
jgi:hypothetical protein